MIVSWLLYNMVLAALIGIGALALERVFRQYGWQTRGIWATALGASVAVPLMTFLLGGSVVGARLASGIVTGMAPATVDAVRGTADRLDLAGGVVLDVWLVASVGLALLFVWSLAAMVGRRKRWSEAVVDGCPVMVSDDTGPAVAGYFKGVIVLPRWALDVDRHLCGLMLEHEREHLRAGDPRLLFLGVVALIYLPLNPVLWWQVRRLRLAVEVDCDARVLKTRREALPAYGQLLLEVGARASGCRMPVPAFSSPANTLEERILAMTSRRPRRHVARAAAFLGITVLVSTGAALVPDPGDVLCMLRSAPAHVAQPEPPPPPPTVCPAAKA